MVRAYTVLAYIVMPANLVGVGDRRLGIHSHGRYSYGIFSYGPYRYGPYSYGEYSYGTYSLRAHIVMAYTGGGSGWCGGSASWPVGWR